MAPYRAILDVPKELISYLFRLLRAERRLRGTRKGTRKSSPWWQAIYGLSSGAASAYHARRSTDI